MSHQPVRLPSEPSKEAVAAAYIKATADIEFGGARGQNCVREMLRAAYAVDGVGAEAGEGEAPQKCPTCGAPASKEEIVRTAQLVTEKLRLEARIAVLEAALRKIATAKITSADEAPNAWWAARSVARTVLEHEERTT